MRTTGRRVGGVALLVTMAAAGPVCAQGSQLTLALATDSAAAPRPTLLVAFGRAPRPAGFEIEYAGSAGSGSHGQRTVGTIAVSALVKMPWRIGKAPLYVTSGFGVYGETGRGSNSGEAPAVHVGAGAVIPLCGELKWRVEYRVLKLFDSEGPVASRYPQRLTTGISVRF